MTSKIRVSFSAEEPHGTTVEEEEGMPSISEESALVAGCLAEEEERFFVLFGVGHLGHVQESWPTSLHQGQALSDPGQDAITTFLSTPSLFPLFTVPHTVFSLKERFFIY